jgi:hypothetical protein
MRAIWKFEIPVGGGVVEMPPGEVISVAANPLDPGVVWIWAIVDVQAEPLARHFEVVGTGHELSDAHTAESFLGTCVAAGGALIWHVFEVTS